MSRGGLALSRGFGGSVRVWRVDRGFGIVAQPFGFHLHEGAPVAVHRLKMLPATAFANDALSMTMRVWLLPRAEMSPSRVVMVML